MFRSVCLLMSCCTIVIIMFNVRVVCYFFFFKQKTAYDMRISDWSSDVCSSDLSCDSISPAAGRDAVAGRVDAHLPASRHLQSTASPQIGRASCRERVCQYV